MRGWFTPEAIDAVMGPAEGESERLAREWLARDGKRWRPLLTVAAFQALREDCTPSYPGRCAVTERRG